MHIDSCLWNNDYSDLRIKEQKYSSLIGELCYFLRIENDCTYNSNVHFCYIPALMLTCFRLTKDCATFFWPETIIANFLHLMVLFYKVIFNHSSKRQFVVIRFRVIILDNFCHHKTKKILFYYLFCFILFTHLKKYVFVILCYCHYSSNDS